MHKVLDFDLYKPEPPSASTHRINLVKDETEQEVLQSDLSLQDVFDKLIEPGKFLYMVTPITKRVAEKLDSLRKDDVPSQTNNYAIVPAHSTPVTVKNPQTDLNQLGGLKGVNLLLSNPVSYTKLAFDRMYQFVENGLPVEVRIRFGPVPLRDSPPPDPTALPWLNNHFPHLRPDFILKSMPEGTRYLVEPVSDGRLVQFVLGREAKDMPKDLTKRLLKVKTAVQESMGKNKMAQNWAKRRRRDQYLEGTSVDPRDTQQTKQALDDVAGKDDLSDEAGQTTEESQEVESAIQRFNATMQGTRQTPRDSNHRHGTWEKQRTKGTKPYSRDDKRHIPKTRGQGFALSGEGESREGDDTPRRGQIPMHFKDR